MIFKSSSLYELSAMNTIRPTLVSKIIIDVIDKDKVIALSQKDRVIDIDTFNINLNVMNA